MFYKRWFQGPSYSPLDDSSTSSGLQRPSIWSRGPFIILFVVLITLSFALGRFSAPSGTTNQSMRVAGDAAISEIVPIDKKPRVFLYNRTFGEDSPTSDLAWTELLPPQGGYFSHPVIAPERSTFSVYHYLHCLNGLRTGFWTALNTAVAGEKLDLEDPALPMTISQPHVRHCIDLLRQALICSPDLTVEVKDEEAGGVHGFGETHQCVDWTALNQWTARWESWRQPVTTT